MHGTLPNSLLRRPLCIVSCSLDSHDVRTLGPWLVQEGQLLQRGEEVLRLGCPGHLCIRVTIRLCTPALSEDRLVGRVLVTSRVAVAVRDHNNKVLVRTSGIGGSLRCVDSQVPLQHPPVRRSLQGLIWPAGLLSCYLRTPAPTSPGAEDHPYGEQLGAGRFAERRPQ